MITKSLNIPYFIQPLTNHKIIKEFYLEEIKKNPINSLDSIHNTDWNIKSNINYSFLLSQLKESLNNMEKYLKVKEAIVHNFWFQQYKKTDYHFWHTHCECHYTNVYYLEVDDGATEVKDPMTNKIITMKVKEGDVLSMPAFLLHRSPKYKTNTTKTVIAFNTSFKNYQEHENQI